MLRAPLRVMNRGRCSPASSSERCPRCAGKLKIVHNQSRWGRSSQLQCMRRHGAYQSFAQFLEEKGLLFIGTGGWWWIRNKIEYGVLQREVDTAQKAFETVSAVGSIAVTATWTNGTIANCSNCVTLSGGAVVAPACARRVADL